MKITILGTGYVGLTTGVALAYIGHDVICVDTNEQKIQQLKEGRIPLYEPHLKELMELCGERLRFSSDSGGAISGADVIYIAVGTPQLADGTPDLTYLRSAAHAIGTNLPSKFTVVVTKSTVPIGSGNWVESLIIDAAENHDAARKWIAVASNPEFLREGSAVSDSLYPDRIVIGADSAAALDLLQELYRPLLEQSFAAPAFLPREDGVRATPLVTTNLASSELIKYAANSFLALKISFINEIGILAEKVGADVRKIAQGIGLDRRIGPRFLQAGIGWGGSCFGKDTAALISIADEYGLAMPIVKSAREVNYRQRGRIIEKLLGELKILRGKTIGLLGVAFKPNTDDLRDSPAIDIARRLLERGAWVRMHDPVALEVARREQANLGVSFVDDVETLAANADALILVTEWPEYLTLPWKQLAQTMNSPILLDGRNVIEPAQLHHTGMKLVCLGVDPAQEMEYQR
jgi:UDPglucose 6-dehydrogenase